MSWIEEDRRVWGFAEMHGETDRIGRSLTVELTVGAAGGEGNTVG